MTINVLLADDQYLIREGIASLLELAEVIEVVGLAENGQDAIAKALELKPHIILMDVRMPEMNGVEATTQIKQALPDCQVIMLTTFDDEEYIMQSLLAGACGYLMKDIPPKDLVQAIQLAHAGVYQLAPEVAGKQKSTRLNSSHLVISYAVFCLKKKNLTTFFSFFFSLLNSCPLIVQIKHLI